MRLATVRRPGGTMAVKITDAGAVDLGFPTVGELLERHDWRRYADERGGEVTPPDQLDYAPVVPRPEKIICVGPNYGMNLVDLGRSFPEHPLLFSKYSRALIGAYDDIVLPRSSHACDWEAELGVVIGAPVRRASRSEALAAIAGYTVVNDVTMRDWQYRTTQWLQGKTFEATTPVGPHLVVPEDRGQVPSYDLSCSVDGELMQEASTDDMVYGPVELICYISEIITLVPGDLISTGTPGGVGHGRQPPRWLTEGSVVTTCIEGVGECTNRCVGGSGPG
jgi:acylpyruvate hydrolase